MQLQKQKISETKFRLNVLWEGTQETLTRRPPWKTNFKPQWSTQIFILTKKISKTSSQEKRQCYKEWTSCIFDTVSKLDFRSWTKRKDIADFSSGKTWYNWESYSLFEKFTVIYEVKYDHFAGRRIIQFYVFLGITTWSAAFQTFRY